MAFFTEVKKKQSCKSYAKIPQIIKDILHKKNTDSGIRLPDFKVYLQRHIDQEIIAQNQTLRLVEKKRGPRNKLMFT